MLFVMIYSRYNWLAVESFLILMVLLMNNCVLLFYSRYNWLAVESFLILTVLVITLYFLAWDDRLEKSEHLDMVKRTLNKLHGM